MMRLVAYIGSVALLTGTSFAQSAAEVNLTMQTTLPSFEAADVHSSPPSVRPFANGPFIHGLRYEIKNASMVDLIRIANGVDPDKVNGGPSWVEFDRFELTAIAPAGSKPEIMKTMLQALLADRFKLVVHTDTKNFPAYALTAKNPKFKESDGSSSEQGCRMMAQAPQQAGLGPVSGPVSLTISESCHNVTMQTFANSIRGMTGLQIVNGAQVTPGPVQDNTELKGTWDLELKFSMPNGPAPNANDTTVFDAVEKQLGLKLEQVMVPMPVVIIDSVNRKPTENAPDLAQKIPAFPTEFDVAEIKPGTPFQPPVAGRAMIRTPPFQNDRVNLQNYSLKSLIFLGWNVNGDDMIVGAPKWLDSEHFDVIAKAPAVVSTVGPTGGRGPIDTDVYRPMIRALMQDRFKMAAHFEDRPGNVYVLSAIKPKMQKANPANRTKCTEGPGADGKDPRKANPAIGRLVTCQNVSMRELAALLPSFAGGYFSTLIEDATGLEGSWDFTLSFSGIGVVNGMGGRGGDGPAPPGGAGVAAASDPSGGLSLFDAVIKQLGLKIEQQKRPTKVLVIDHIEQKPTDN